MRARVRHRSLILVLCCVGLLVDAGRAFSDVVAVNGSAFGYFADNVSVFGGPQADTGPTPTVTLAPDASNSPVTATATTGLVQYGPAVLFTSDLIQLSSAGTLGPTGSVSSSASILDIDAQFFTADSISALCTATLAGTTCSTTIINGLLDIVGGPVPVPTNPAPNTLFSGQFDAGGSLESFQIVFNELTTNLDGSVTLTAVHQRLLGPVVIADLYLGRVVAGVTNSTPPPASVPEPTTLALLLVGLAGLGVRSFHRRRSSAG